MAVLAACGWLLDASVYWFLATSGFHVFIANIIGNCIGIIFTFALSPKHAFGSQEKHQFGQLILYASFCFAMIPVFSGLLSWIYHSGMVGLISSKVIVTIPSFICNYLFMRWLVNKKNVR